MTSVPRSGRPGCDVGATAAGAEVRIVGSPKVEDERGLTANRDPQSAIKNERALQRVVSAQIQLDAELLVLRRVPRALSYEHRCTRHGGKYGINESSRRTCRVFVGFELRITCVANPERTFSALHIELDRHLLYGHDFPDELHKLGDRATQLARVHRENRLLLCGAHLLVEIHRRSPVAL